MARDRGPPVLWQSPASPRLPAAALPAEARGWGWLGAGLWPALVVGLLAALVAWFWYGGSDGQGEESGEAAPAVQQARGEAEATENLLVSSEEVLRQAKTTALSSPQKPGEDLTAAPGASGEVCKDRSEEQLCQPAESRDLDHEDWEVVSEHLDWGEAGQNGSMEDSDSKEWEQGDCSDGDLKAKRVAAVPPMFQNIHVTFRVHYITHSGAQLIGVTGDHECLGQWHSYVPLKYDKDGFWSESVTLPVDTKVEWKFILVENGKVTRWEECSNRTLVTEHEDQIAHQWWGYH
ncbi:starch-binding domain-containing protein 1 isoform X2 [Gallus gallus]|uniref:Starch-binding domain-containing protein 1 n=1 Tax=Gallus gallus TaxID=9031 RepID=R4GJM5_CHICK|nr:starch-binding domain-containing protein 1 isoform X2 [Gallus gallus]XP_429975.4 starch-binding domain-containing protein 1 isoform X2 [Gallus gallus]|eukprot:XP_429975.4 starch-binding domain-containing protein 1 isoform X2 [Gallus gallus]